MTNVNTVKLIKTALADFAKDTKHLDEIEVNIQASDAAFELYQVISKAVARDIQSEIQQSYGV